MTESAAPGGLETVRTFVNTWRVPNDTRVPEDRLTAEAWGDDFPGLPRAGSALAELRRLRQALRAELGAERPAGLRGWLEEHPVRAVLSADPGEAALVLRAEDGTAAGAILALVAEAVRDGRWSRLKACPDCAWVFYDHSRNGGRRWCAMNAGAPDGRGCGSIAKVRAYRERRR
ncbi:CGNR zinc finger domain-containing protein [Nonomuraea sp. NBC_01738]|uniref:CGNR zinc finger domain-containing protein n=1 Tax=Nonomuraea sp. NBC_01738 TaxID=2976003 RepID=UPI002E14C26D|nr:CGNR zinc finger domain-containing protein [Nonomuraea sp. NBC_01738]